MCLARAGAGVGFVVRPAVDRARPDVVGRMTVALDGLLRSDQAISGLMFLRPG